MLHSPVFGPGDLTSPYLVAMAHQEWRTQQVLKKHWRNRPLGRLHDSYKYRPAQPVLSCRTVNVDLSGTRTYRARTADDIIEEQHKVIHNLYTNARNVSSAPVRKISPRLQNNPSALRQLTIQGNSPGKSPSSRPTSKAQSATSILKHKRRPHTTPSSSRSVTFHDDPEWAASSEAYKDVTAQIRDQWDNPETRSLDHGEYIRGKRDLDTGSKAGGKQWMKFGGGRGDAVESRGASSKGSGTPIIEAFTQSPRGEAPYSIDGRSGSEVARQLQSGERVRVGVNGIAVNSWVEQHRDLASSNGSEVPFSSSPVELENSLDTMVPLCWTDQVHKSEVKVIEARSPHSDKNIPSMSESKPVIYGRASSSASDADPAHSRSKLTTGTTSEGYAVKVRTKNRKGMDGSERSSAKITNISIDNQPGNQDEVLLSYEDLLDINVKANKHAGISNQAAAAGNSISPQPHAAIVGAASTGGDSRPVGNGTVKKSGGRVPADKNSDNSLPRALKDSQHEKDIVNKVNREQSQQDLLMSRPVTAMSRMSMDSDLDLVVQPGTSRSNLSTPMGGKAASSSGGSLRSASNPRAGGPRTTSAGRPPPQKPHLHKTNAASGASVQSGTKIAETEYIHFTHQLIGSQEFDLPKRTTASSTSTAAILSISNHNNPGASAANDGQQRNGQRSISPVFSNQPLPSSPSGGSITSPRVLSDDGIPTPPPSSPRDPHNLEEEKKEKEREEEERKQQEQVHYAFNIPTADTVESEIDPTELHPVLEEAKEEEEAS